MQNLELTIPNPERVAYYSENAPQLAEQYSKVNRKAAHGAMVRFYETPKSPHLTQKRR